MMHTRKRILSFLLAAAMIFSMFPTAFAAEHEHTTAVRELTEEDYAVTDSVWEEITAKEDAMYAKKATSAQVTDAVIATVEASENYVDGSLERNGDSFTWMTEEGIACHYSPYLREKMRNAEINPSYDPATDVATETISYAAKGGSPAAKDVYLIEPYYGIDSSFTTQYQTEARSIAAATGGTYTLYKTTDATVDNIAKAIMNGAVVIFDSHGDTDYAKGEDFTSGATTSYLCLQSGTGLTTEDYANNHALYGGSNGSMKYYEVDGTAIANHITGTCPNNMVWMAICLGMATDGLYKPLRAKGVEVVYGYSQSVTFDGDYAYEGDFFNQMKAGKNVATAVSYMKTRNGNWDPAYYLDGVTTIASARANYCAFPIVASSEDTYPGHGKVDDLQTVKSTWTLMSQYAVTAVSSNTAYGTVSVSGNTITASPAEGYYVASAAVTSGSGTCTVNGNTITVNATSDCTVTVTFAPKTPVTVSFTVPAGVSQGAMNGYSGDAITLPAPTGAPTADAQDYVFAGWAETPVSDTDSKPVLYAAGSSYTPTATTTLYAVYSYSVNDGTGTGDYVKVTEAPADWSGEYVIVYEANQYILDGSLTTVDAVSNYQTVTITDNTIAAADADAYKVTIAPMAGGYSIQCASGKYIGNAANSNALTSSDTAMANTLALAADGTVDIKSSGGAYLRYNAAANQWRFRYYKSGTYASQQAICLYVKDGSSGTTYYTTELGVACEHNWVAGATVPATCTTDGYTEYTCSLCGASKQDDVVAAFGHTFGAWASNDNGTHTHTCQTCGESETADCTYTTVVTPPTETEEGYTTYTCDVCGYSYVGDKVPALGAKQTVAFVVPAGVTAVEDMAAYAGESIVLPAAEGTPEANAQEYTFAGWVAAEVDNSTEAPTILKAGDSYTVSASATLYALYTYAVAGEGGSTEYTLVTDANQLSTGSNVVIAASDYNTAISTTQSGNNRPEAAVNKDGSTLTFTTGVAELTLGAGTTDGTYSFYDSTAANSGYLYAASSGSNYLRTEATLSANSSWKITVTADGVATVVAQGANTRNTMQYNLNSKLFACYASASQKAVSLYIKGAGDTTYYTTVLESEIACDHVNTTETTVPATCTTDGSVTVTCDDCGKVISTTVIAATGHSYDAGVVTTEATCTTDGVMTFTCANCADSYTTAIPATGHTYGACTSNNDGTHTFVCETCAVEDTVDCTYTAVVTPPTETEEGYTTYTCDACGYSYVGDKVPALGEKQTVAFVVPAGVTAVEDMAAYAGESIVLPAAEGTPEANAQEYTFAGWVAAEVDNSTEAPTILKAGDSYTVSASATLYALYTYAVAGEGGSTEYTLVTDAAQLVDGASVVIAAKDYDRAMSATQGSNNRPEAVVTKDGNTLIIGTDVAELMLGAGTTAGTYSFYDEANGGYLYAASSSKNYLRTEATLSANSSWKITVAADGTATVTAQGSYTHNDLEYNANTSGGLIFSCYASGQKPVSLYTKGAGGTTYYTTVLESEIACDHVNTTETTVPATCTTDGSVTVTCDDCGKVISTTVIAATGHSYDAGVITTEATCTTDGVMTFTCANCADSYTTAIPATGHTYGACTSNNDGTHTFVCETCAVEDTVDCTYTAVVTPPTETEEGYTTYTCDVCGYSYVGDKVPALGAKQTVAFVVPAGVTAVEDMAAYAGESIVLPAAEGTPEANAQEYTFAGWVAAEVDNSTEAPTILKAGDSYTVSASATLYALYTYAVAGEGGSTEYTLVTDAAQLVDGASVVIAAKDFDYAIGTTQNTNNRAAAAITKSDNTLSFTAGVAELTLGAGTTDGTYSFYDEANSGYLYAASSSKNYLHTKDILDGNSSWTIEIAADGTATVVATGTNTNRILQYNNGTSTNLLFSCYGSATQKAISLYAKGAGGTTYYTTVLENVTECTHANTEIRDAVEATCTTAGYTGDVYCADCGVLVSSGSAIDALGHDMVAGTVHPATCTEDGYTEYACSRCDATDMGDIVDALGHDYSVMPELTDEEHYLAPTCTEDGLVSYKCSRCDSFDPSATVLPATGHTVVTDPAVPATCTTDGLTEGSHCSVCDAVLVAQVVVPATGHTYAYTDNGDGTHTVSCANCDYSAVEDHTFADGECVCGAKETVEDPYLDETLVIYSKSLNLQSYIGVDYTVRNKVAANYDSFYVAVSVGDGEEQVLEPISAGSYTYFELKTTATQMTENLTATLYAVKDGVTYHGQSVEWNVRDGIMDKIAAIKDLSVEKNLQQMTLMVDMLNYGAAAQIRFNNRVDDLANNKLTDEHKAYATTTNPELTATITQTDNGDNRVTFFSENLSLESSIEFAITLKTKGMDVANLEAHISYGTTEDVVALTPFNGTYSVLNYNKLACNQLREPVSITIYDKTTGKPVSATLNCSVEAIAATMVGTQADIIYATMRYGDSAKAFYG